MNPRTPFRFRQHAHWTSPDSWQRVRLVMAVWLTIAMLCAGHDTVCPLGAQDGPAPTEQGSPETPRKALDPVNEAVVGTYDRTLTLTSDREFEIRLRSAHSAFQIGNSTEGVRVLAELLALPEPHLIENRSTFRDVRDEVTRMLKAGSQELRDQFRRETEVRATAELDAARADGNLPALLALVNRYPQTPTARDAAQLFAQHMFDSGRFDTVIQVASRWIENAPDAQVEAQLCQPLISLWFQATRATLGPTAADQLAQRFLAENADVQFHVPIAPDQQVPETETVVQSWRSWQVDSPLPPASAALLQEILQLLRRNGVQPQLTSRPLVCRDRVVWRSSTEMICIRGTDGTILWRTPLTDSVYEDVESWTARPDENLGQRVKSQLGHRLLRDSNHGQLSCDGERVYCVEQAPDWIPPPKNGKADAADQEFQAPIPARTIVARSLETGEQLWRSNEIWDAGHQGLYIFGPPSIQGSSLFVVVQQQEQLLLFRIDARTGRLERASLLGDCAPPMQDRRRLTQVSPIVWDGSLAICATGAGAVVAYDTTLDKLSWAFRHPRNDNVAPAQFFLQIPTGHRGWQWFHDWRESQLLRSGDRLIYATPESRQIRCLLVSGELQWEIPADDGTSLAAIDAQRLLVQADHSLRFCRLSDGTMEFEFHSSDPIASAHWDGAACEIVFGNGHRKLWNPAQGQVRRLAPLAARVSLVAPAGSLRPLLGKPLGLRSVSAIGSQRFAVTGQGISLVDGRSEQGESVPSLDWENSSAASQVQKLSQWVLAIPEPQRSIRRRHALAEIAWGLESCPAWVESATVPCIEWSFSLEEQIELSWRLLDRSLQDQRTDDALSHLQSLLSQDPLRWEIDAEMTSLEADAERPRTVRLDAAIRGTLQQHWNRCDAAQRDRLQSGLQTWARREETIQGGWAQTLKSLEFLSEPPSPPEPVDSLARLAAQQLGMIRQSTRTDQSQAAVALFQLAEFQLQRGDRTHATALLNQVQKKFKGVPLPDSMSPAGLLSKLSEPESKDFADWPQGPPLVTVTDTFAEGEYMVPMDVRAERGSPFDRIGMLCPGLPQKHIVFSMDNALTWSTKLPTSQRNVMSEHWLRRGWAFGEFVVLQYGSELYCVSSRKVQGTGKPKSSEQFLWPKFILPSQSQEKQKFVDTLGDEDNRLQSSENRRVIQSVGFIRPEFELFDAHGRRRTWAGPVTAGITCFLQQGMLVCLETATGQELWRRYDMPGEVRVFGDDEVIGILHDTSKQVDLLSPLDGRTLRTVSMTAPGELLHHWGRHLLLASGQPRLGTPLTPRKSPPAAPTEPEAEKPADSLTAPAQKPDPVPPVIPLQPLDLSLLDLDGMRVTWTRSYPAGSAAFEVDEEWIGVLHAGGKIEFLDRRTGNLIHETPVELPQGLEAVAASVTDRMIYVSLSSAISSSQLTKGTRRWRWPLINGPIYAFDRQTGQLVWTRVIENRGFPLNQPRDIPVLLLIDTWEGSNPLEAKKSKSMEHWSRFLILDSRTGQTLQEEAVRESSPRYSFQRFKPPVESLRGELTSDKKSVPWIELKLNRKKIRLEYPAVPQ